jgi:hypothetical protein
MWTRGSAAFRCTVIATPGPKGQRRLVIRNGLPERISDMAVRVLLRKGRTYQLMKFTTIKSETSLADLTHHVFDIKGSKSAAAKGAQAMLREANPHLGDLTKLPAGTLVIVPDVPGVKASASQSLTGVSPAIVAQLKQVLADAEAVLEGSVTSAAREIETSASLVKIRDLVALAKQTPELQQLLPQIAEQAKVQFKQVEATKTDQIQGLAQLEKDLGSLTG